MPPLSIIPQMNIGLVAVTNKPKMRQVKVTQAAKPEKYTERPGLAPFTIKSQKQEKVAQALRLWKHFAPFYEMQYVCGACDKLFSKFSELRRHLFINHVCLPCNLHFESAEGLSQHITTQHPSGIKCNTCDSIAHATALESFRHHCLAHPKIFLPMTCMCSRMCTNRRLEEHLQVVARQQANQLWLKGGRDLTMEVRCEVEISPPLFGFMDELTFEVSCSVSVTKSET